MKLSKKVLISSILISVCTLMFAQAADSEDYEEVETSVESEYLNDIDDVEGEIIAALAKTNDLATKLNALQSLQEAIDGGNTSKAVIESLDRLAGEGVTTEERKNGRLVNNFPEVRMMACKLMSKVPTEHSQKTLSKIAINDSEPSVIAAAVESLATIAIDPDSTAKNIAWASKQIGRTNPDSTLALTVLNAFEKIGTNVEDKIAFDDMIEEIKTISVNYNYPRPIRLKALSLLKQLTGRSAGTDTSEK